VLDSAVVGENGAGWYFVRTSLCGKGGDLGQTARR
jgi:hypothetical protein